MHSKLIVMLFLFAQLYVQPLAFSSEMEDKNIVIEFDENQPMLNNDSDETIYLDSFNRQISENREMESLKRQIQIESLKFELQEIKMKTGQGITLKPSEEPRTVTISNDLEESCPIVVLRLNTGQNGDHSLVGFYDNGELLLVSEGSKINNCLMK